MSSGQKPIPGFSNPRCYAHALKGCSPKMSGEHPVSKAILKRVHHEFTESDLVEVKNMAFQLRGASEMFSVGVLESKILCSHHNDRLSPFDDEALLAFNAFEIMHYAGAGIAPAAEAAYNVDGDKFERWMLKVVCGGLYGGTMRADDGTELKDVEPPLDWLQTLYEGKAFPDGFGLYCDPPKGEDVITVDRSIVKWSPLILHTEEQTVVHGLRLWLFGFRFTLLATGPQQRAVEAMAGQSYRPNGCVLDGSGTHVNFAWADGPGSAEISVRLV